MAASKSADVTAAPLVFNYSAAYTTGRVTSFPPCSSAVLDDADRVYWLVQGEPSTVWGLDVSAGKPAPLPWSPLTLPFAVSCRCAEYLRLALACKCTYAGCACCRHTATSIRGLEYIYLAASCGTQLRRELTFLFFPPFANRSICYVQANPEAVVVDTLTGTAKLVETWVTPPFMLREDLMTSVQLPSYVRGQSPSANHGDSLCNAPILRGWRRRWRVGIHSRCDW